MRATTCGNPLAQSTPLLLLALTLCACDPLFKRNVVVDLTRTTPQRVGAATRPSQRDGTPEPALAVLDEVAAQLRMRPANSGDDARSYSRDVLVRWGAKPEEATRIFVAVRARVQHSGQSVRFTISQFLFREETPVARDLRRLLVRRLSELYGPAAVRLTYDALAPDLVPTSDHEPHGDAHPDDPDLR